MSIGKPHKWYPHGSTTYSTVTTNSKCELEFCHKQRVAMIYSIIMSNKYFFAKPSGCASTFF